MLLQGLASHEIIARRSETWRFLDNLRAIIPLILTIAQYYFIGFGIDKLISLRKWRQSMCARNSDFADLVVPIHLALEQRSRCFPAGLLDQPFDGWVNVPIIFTGARFSGLFLKASAIPERSYPEIKIMRC